MRAQSKDWALFSFSAREVFRLLRVRASLVSVVGLRLVCVVGPLLGCSDEKSRPASDRVPTQRELDTVAALNRAADKPLVDAQAKMCGEVFAATDIVRIVGTDLRPDELVAGMAPSSEREAWCAYRTSNDEQVSLFVICGVGRMPREERRSAWANLPPGDPMMRGRTLVDTKTGVRVKSDDGKFCLDFDYVADPPCDLKLSIGVGGPNVMDALVAHVKSRLTKANAP